MILLFKIHVHIAILSQSPIVYISTVTPFLFTYFGNTTCLNLHGKPLLLTSTAYMETLLVYISMVTPFLLTSPWKHHLFISPWLRHFC